MVRLIKYCKIEECNRKTCGRGLCNTHYAQFRKHGEIINKIIKIYDKFQGCKIDHCKRKHHCKGLCKKHYDQLPQRRKNNIKRVKKWREDNPEWGKNYYQKNIEKILENQIKHLKKLGYKINMEYKEVKYTLLTWSRIIRKRDNYKCVICGSQDDLNAHHIFPKSKYPALMFNINNGITLCKTHHKETEGKKLEHMCYNGN